jgi:hypothetical protein
MRTTSRASSLIRGDCRIAAPAGPQQSRQPHSTRGPNPIKRSNRRKFGLRVCGVETMGLEPTTPGLQSRCSSAVYQGKRRPKGGLMRVWCALCLVTSESGERSGPVLAGSTPTPGTERRSVPIA